MMPSNPRKKMKTESGFLVTLLDEQKNVGESTDAVVGFIDSSSDADSRREKNRDATCTTLLDLSNDCLYAVFGPSNVSIIDLCAIARTCTRLNAIGKRIFERKHKYCKFREMAVEDTVEARRVLQTFGPLMVEIEVSNPTVGIMDAIIRYCTSLVSLVLKAYRIPDNQEKINAMAELFRKLQKLYIKYVAMEGAKESDHRSNNVTPKGNSMDFFVNCNSLIKFKVTECYDLEQVILSSVFLKLKHFLCETDNPNFCNEMQDFFLSHRNLKTFRLENFDFVDHISVLKVITDCKNLENLQLGLTWGGISLPRQVDMSLKSLKELQCLKRLIITFVGDHISKLVKELPRLSKLEVLHLNYLEGISELIPAVSQLKQLRIFRLHNCHKFADINQVSELSQLIELSFEYVTTDNFDLIKIVEGLPNLRKLTFFVNKFKISKQVYLRLAAVVECRPASHQALEIKCPTTNDFNDLLRATVKLT